MCIHRNNIFSEMPIIICYIYLLNTTLKFRLNLENVYDLKSNRCCRSENDESDVLKEYAEKPNELDVENEYQEIYLNNPKLFDGDVRMLEKILRK